MSEAASYYYPDEPIELYEPEYSSVVELPPPAREIVPPLHLSLLPCIRKAPAAPQSFAAVALCTVADLEERTAEEFIELAALQFTVICRKMRREWTGERIAQMRPQLCEANRALQALIKPQPKRRFDPTHPLLFD